jgi:UDP-N-acetylglucosamine/UDP-N-acetylgalactosamine 4-epimerase
MSKQTIQALAPIPSWLSRELSQIEPRRWVVTGCAGFIGSNIVENLLINNQYVVGLDNFSTGHRKTLNEMITRVGAAAEKFEFINGDIQDKDLVDRAVLGADHVLHQAALGSVPRSIQDPITSIESNVNGFNVVLRAVQQAKITSFVYASSSSVYGDHPALPKIENVTGRPLSPYAGTKVANELFANIFSDAYEMYCTGLRYFNVFGPRQDPNGPYAAVIPRWIDTILSGQPIVVNGDGSTSRDFCYVANVVQANILAALKLDPERKSRVFNIAFGNRANLLELHAQIQSKLKARIPTHVSLPPTFSTFRAGDVLHSHADIAAARSQLGYQPEFSLDAGLNQALPWYLEQR